MAPYGFFFHFLGNSSNSGVAKDMAGHYKLAPVPRDSKVKHSTVLINPILHFTNQLLGSNCSL